ncbi:MAG TPA: Ni/Fe-hydrogenase cytochrome b subunit [Candidatus Krumholzibacteria bacterium]|nr:Ni/Fe-hydrogenase cytochrome b subunit [Candidatus Krumholzibacteria bacterium]
MSHAKPTPVGGNLWNGTTRVLMLFAVLGIGLTIWRFMVGLGPSTGLSDGYPWGIWIAFDVVTGTALGCGGYAIAFLVYVANRGRYHALVRPALLTSALGYTIAALAIVIDVGRPWFIWRIPVSVGHWNLNSALLEVALCVMTYVLVLWIELSPAFLEKSKNAAAASLARFLDRIMVFIVALGLLLPTMHQSSLGSVIMLAGPRLHPLWQTQWLPLLFLISCIAMGYAIVVIESTLSSRAFGRAREDRMLATLSRTIAFVLLAYVALRLGAVVAGGKAPLLLGAGAMSVLFWLEIALFAVPALVLLARGDAIRIGDMYRMALTVLVAGALYRFDAYLVAFSPSAGWSYFPSVPELLMTVGLVALEILVFIAIVRKFPILGGTVAKTAAR